MDIVFVQVDFEITNGAAFKSLQAVAPPGYQVVAGGFDVSGLSDAYVSVNVQELNQNGLSESWLLRVENPQASNGVVSLIATCVG